MAIYKLTIGDRVEQQADDLYFDIAGEWNVDQYGLEVLRQEEDCIYACKDGAYPDLPDWLTCERLHPINLPELRIWLERIYTMAETNKDKVFWTMELQHNAVQTVQGDEHTFAEYIEGNRTIHLSLYEGRTKQENIEQHNKALCQEQNSQYKVLEEQQP